MNCLLKAMITLTLWLASVPLAQAINITLADVQSGVAVVQGTKAAKQASMTWETTVGITTATKSGSFSFSSNDVPADCVGTLSDGVSTIDVTLANCTPTPVPPVRVLRTGQTACVINTVWITCPGSPAGQDGELQKGTARSYTVNADGTITDNSTGLVWEKLVRGLDGYPSGDPHDVDNQYTWVNAFAKIAGLNTTPCFADHCDWRLPNVNELQTLADYGRVSLAIDPVFNSADSVTYPSYYWSSTSYQPSPDGAWSVNFIDGALVPTGRPGPRFVRAVRGP